MKDAILVDINRKENLFNMRKNINKIVGLTLCIGMLTGCAQTPESSLVKPKGSKVENAYTETEGVDMVNEDSSENTKDKNTAVRTTIRDLLNAPETYKSQTTDDSAKLVVNTDATVEIPDVEKISAISVTPAEVTQDLLDRITDAFFSEAKLYTSDSYYTQTKDEIKKTLDELKEDVANGNLDPYNWGTDEDGNLYYNIYDDIVSKSRYYDDEFHACYEELKRALKKGLVQLVPKMSLLCCDNLYQRVTAGTKDTIPFDCNQFFNGKLKDSFLPFDLNSGIYAPNACIIGSFKVLGAQKGKNNATIAELKVAYKGCFTCPSVEAERIPMLPENYIASQEVEEILEMVTHTPARLFMMTGEAGTGKTTDARMLAQILGLPYYVFTCGPGTDELELLASTVPNMGTKKRMLPQLPDFQDLQMDPASALYVLSGIYEDGISEGEAFHKLLSLAFEKGYESARKEKDFFLKESEIIKACRRPSVLEIQEPSMIEKPGTLTRLNSLFDDGAVTDLINGEKIRRDPNTIIIMTTNLDYVGCGNFNQSVLSRMSLIQPKQELTEEEMKQRITARTGYADENVLRFMISVVKKIHAYLKEEDLQDGVCGYRELENWVLTFRAIKDIRRAAQIAVLSKAAMDPEEQEHLMKTYIEPYYSKQE